MKAKASVLLFGVVALPIYAQPFQNLNFEEANPVIVSGSPYYPNEVYENSALPGWAVSIGGTPQSQIFYNRVSTGAPAADLISSSYLMPAIDGNYSVYLQASGIAPTVVLSQTGTIPAGSQTLLFEAQPSIGALDLTVGNQPVPFVAMGVGPNYTLFGANISAWAGDQEQISFSPETDSSGPNAWMIDDITFSTVPEPSPLALTVVGGMILALRRRLRQR